CIVSKVPTATKRLPETGKIELIIFCVLIVTYAYFLQDYRNDNIVTRMSLNLSILRNGTLKINEFHEATGDKSFFNDDYYSDKAPGMSFTSLPITTISYYILLLIDPNPVFLVGNIVSTTFGVLVYFSTVLTSGLLTAITALILYSIALELGAGVRGAVFAMVSFGMGTLAWGWATVMFGHALAGACIFLGFSAVFYASRYKNDRTKMRIFGFAAGAFLAWAVVVEYPAAIASFMVALYGLYEMRTWDRNARIQFLKLFLMGFLFFIIPLFVYNTIVFGSPFSIGYSHLQTFEGMQEGFFGVTLPNLTNLYHIVISPYRGLLWFSPILLLSPIGIYLIWRTPKTRNLALLITALAIYYILLNSAYFYWEGGRSTGPRHIIPIIPFLSLPISMVWLKARSSFKPFLVSLFFFSFLISFISVSVSMLSTTKIQNPLFDLLIPGFIHGEGRNLMFSIFMRILPLMGYNLKDTSLAGHLSKLPILLIWLIGYFLVANRIDKIGVKQPD
ncbi:MAG: hypothetical protein ACK2TV_01600, partial [Anaerolineales bacterium]